MADLSKTIAIIFSGVDELSGPINSITKELDTFSGNVEALAAPLAGAADNILAVDAAVTALAAGGLLYAFNQSKNFESAVIELKKVLGDGAGVDEAIDEATRLSEIYGQSAESILLSAADFKQAGYELEDALTLTADALDLVIAGNLDAAQASDLIIAALKGFKLEADDARRYIDILNEVSNNYATDTEQLAIAMSKIAPIAKQMGFSMEEVAGLVTPVIEIFRSGDEAATALKTGLLKLVDDAKPVRDALASIGVAQYDANGQLRDGRAIYLDVAKAFQTLDEDQKLFITSQLVGIEQSARMVNVFDNLDLALEITATAMKSAGSASAEVAQRLLSAEISVLRFKVAFDNLSTTIGDQSRASVFFSAGTALLISDWVFSTDATLVSVETSVSFSSGILFISSMASWTDWISVSAEISVCLWAGMVSSSPTIELTSPLASSALSPIWPKCFPILRASSIIAEAPAFISARAESLHSESVAILASTSSRSPSNPGR